MEGAGLERFGVKVEHPRVVIERLLSRLGPVGVETVRLDEAAGRVLAQPLIADRDSPACDVSAMDGYAVNRAALHDGWLAVSGEAPMGQAPPALQAPAVVRIFTGGAAPAGADAVVRREDTQEQPDRIRLRVPVATIAAGQNIRRRGENLQAGMQVLEPGRLIDPALAGALASFGVVMPKVHRPVRVAVVTTGSEVVGPDTPAEALTPWQVRDSNASTLRARLDAWPWVRLTAVEAVTEDAAQLEALLRRLAEACDAILLTGGVSMGDHDHVPEVVQSIGGQVVFHRLPIRPGKPILGAVLPGGQAVLGLPGNPVSVLTMSKVFGRPILAHLAGMTQPFVPGHRVALASYDGRSIPMWWYRPVVLRPDGRVELARSMGSGDVVGAARADGLIEVPPDTCELAEAWYWGWT